MRKLTAVLAVAIAATVAQPAEAQLIERAGGILTGRTRVDTRTDRRVDPRTGEVYGRTSTNASSRVPRGHLPPPGMCRVWVDGVPPGHQPKPTNCSTAEAERHRYGANARVIYGDQTPHPGKGRASRDSRSGGSYETVINGRRCRVYENYENGIRRDVTRCEQDGSVWDRRDDDDDDDRWERDGRDRDRRSIDARARIDDDKDRRKASKSKGKGKGNGKGNGRGRD